MENVLPGDSITILIPVFNDWEALEALINQLDATLTQEHLDFNLLIVDDGSTRPYPEGFCGKRNPEGAVQAVEILSLARNLGHQRAIVIGLSYIEHEKPECQAVVVMDGDGEDSPTDVPRLYKEYLKEKRSKVIFAQRSERSEHWIFKMFYSIYKRFYRLSSGSRIRVGNFSIVPRLMLHKIVAISEIWNHYAAGLMKARVPHVEIPTKRAGRLAGRSRMNFTSLVLHGLGAISVHVDLIGIRALIGAMLLVLLSAIGVVVVVGIRFLTDFAIPGWASFVALSLLIILMQALMLAMLFVFIILSTRSSLGFIPRRDYKYFIFQIEKIF